MLTYRRIAARDIDQVVAFAIRGLHPEKYPLRMSEQRIRKAFEHFMASTTDFHMAAFDGDTMVGGVAMVVSPMPWFERLEAHIVMLFATHPGAGFRLMRMAMQWASDHMGIRRVLWPLEDDVNPQQQDRLMSIAERYGFNRRQAVLLAYKE